MAGMGWGTGQDFIWFEQAPEMQWVIQRLGEKFGPNLHFFPEEDDDDYLNFHVWGMTDDNLFRALEENKDELFGSKLHAFQILRPLDRSSDRGVFIRYLEPKERSEFKSGFSHY